MKKGEGRTIVIHERENWALASNWALMNNQNIPVMKNLLDLSDENS